MPEGFRKKKNATTPTIQIDYFGDGDRKLSFLNFS